MGNITDWSALRHKFTKYPPGTAVRARAFLADYFSPDETQWLQYTPGATIWHVCPYWIARGLRELDRTPRVFVGRLETFAESMRKLGRIARVNLPPPRTMGHHPVERDIVARMEKEAMLAFLANSTEWSSRLARRYKPDICLFRYNTTTCGDMVQFRSLTKKLVLI